MLPESFSDCEGLGHSNTGYRRGVEMPDSRAFLEGTWGTFNQSVRVGNGHPYSRVRVLPTRFTGSTGLL
jgi:hypothetical protein